MTYKEASEIIQKHRDMINNTFPNSLMAIENTEALEVAIKALEQQDKEQWIPVKERLPSEHPVPDNNGETVSNLVFVTVKDCDNSDIFVCDDVTVGGQWINFGNLNDYKVIAWSPMPEPYKEIEK